MLLNLLIAGFGGQGVLFMGKVAAYTAMVDEKFVSWLPSYGPEMRGGTANCSVCIDDKEIGCPIVLEPETLVVLNRPSFDKFIGDVCPGGKVFVDSALIDVKTDRTDIDAYYIPATKMAADAGIPTLANMIILGKMIKETGAVSFENMVDVMKKIVSAKRAELIDINIKALEAGYNYEG